MIHVKFYNHATANMTQEIPLREGFVAVKITKKNEKKSFPMIAKLIGDAKDAFLIKEDSFVWILVFHRDDQLKLDQGFCRIRDDENFKVEEYVSPRALYITSTSFANWRAERSHPRNEFVSFAGYCCGKFLRWVDQSVSAWKSYEQDAQRKQASMLGLFSPRDEDAARILCRMRAGLGK